MHLRGEPTTATFLNYHTSLLNSRHLSFIFTDRVASTPHQRNFSAAEAIAENHNWSKGRGQITSGCLSPTDKSITQSPLSRLTEWRLDEEDAERPKEEEDQDVFCKAVCSTYDMELQL